MVLVGNGPGREWYLRAVVLVVMVLWSWRGVVLEGSGPSG